MPKVIDHEKRKTAILHQAFGLFARHGYRSTSLSQLAEACRISRPILYRYFCDKEEIFTYAVKHYTDKMFSGYRNIAALDGPTLPLIRRVISDIIFRSWYSRNFITSLGDYIFQKRRENVDFSQEIHRRTVKLEHLLQRMLRQGIRNGELRNIPVSITVTQLLDFVQAYLFKLAILNTVDPPQTIAVIGAFLDSLSQETEEPGT